jgi:hypothetical protein
MGHAFDRGPAWKARWKVPTSPKLRMPDTDCVVPGQGVTIMTATLCPLDQIFV